MIKFYITKLLFYFSVLAFAQDTFSIVAVDSTTGEIGSAGATCLQAPNPPIGALIISDVIPGVGAMHTQALWEPYNQQNGHTYMSAGFMPKDILYEVNISDIAGDSTIRQYGIALFDANGHPRTGAYTGVNCYDYKGHIEGPYYTIQGNIITDHALLDSMEYNFLNTPGTLADKLMAALQGANFPGADTRCLPEGVPSKSAFLRVAKPDDADTALYLDLLVKSRPYGMSPIDSLQTLYNEWKASQPSDIQSLENKNFNIWPNPATNAVHIQFTEGRQTLSVTDMVGNVLETMDCNTSCTLSLKGYSSGVYFFRSGDRVRRLVVR